MSYPEQQMQTFIEAGISEADRCYTRIAELEEQNSALAAQVEALRIAALNAISFMSGGETKAQLRDAYDATPQQHLAELKAEAGQAGFVAGVNWVFNTDFVEINLTNSTEAANQYADSILQEK